jgi:hypothetical protein
MAASLAGKPGGGDPQKADQKTGQKAHAKA